LLLYVAFHDRLLFMIHISITHCILKCREVTEHYGREVLGVVDKLLSAFSINLGLEESTVRNALGGENMEMELKINYYPACPQPEMALGVLPHTDMSALTVLKPNDVPGLQIFKNNEWVTAKYVPNTLIIHIGDQLQVTSSNLVAELSTKVQYDKLKI
jgi:flavonol synthase